MSANTILELQDANGALFVTAQTSRLSNSVERYFDVTFEVVAPPFSGRFTSTVMAEDLTLFRSNISRLTVPGSVILGGQRAPELQLRVENQQGGAADRLAVEVSLTPSADDPYPRITFLVFDQLPFARIVSAALDELLAEGE